MEQNTVTINQLIAQILDEMRRIGYSESTIWRVLLKGLPLYGALCTTKMLGKSVSCLPFLRQSISAQLTSSGRRSVNGSLDTDDVVDWCKAKINSSNTVITRKGKNWYVNVDNYILTVNAYSYTIITAHKEKK